MRKYKKLSLVKIISESVSWTSSYKINSEISHWKSRYEGEGLVGAEEVEEAKRKQIARYLDLQDALNAAHNKISSLEKAKSRLMQETEDARSDVDRWIERLLYFRSAHKNYAFFFIYFCCLIRVHHNQLVRKNALLEYKYCDPGRTVIQALSLT